MRLNARVSTDTHIGSVLLPAMAVIALISTGAQKCYYSVLATRQSTPFVRTLTMRRQFFCSVWSLPPIHLWIWAHTKRMKYKINLLFVCPSLLAWKFIYILFSSVSSAVCFMWFVVDIRSFLNLIFLLLLACNEEEQIWVNLFCAQRREKKKRCMSLSAKLIFMPFASN